MHSNALKTPLSPFYVYLLVYMLNSLIRYRSFRLITITVYPACMVYSVLGYIRLYWSVGSHLFRYYIIYRGYFRNSPYGI